MSDLDELERRIAAALDRIAGGLESLSARAAEQAEAGPTPAQAEVEAEVERLRESLDSERQASAQLEERVKELRRRLEADAAAHQAELEEARTRLENAERRASEAVEQSQRVRQTNQRMRQSVQAMRDAAAGGEADAGAINEAMLSELEALTATREADRVELDAVLRELKPLLQEDAHA